MEWVPLQLLQGGPWVLLGLVVLGVSALFWRGLLVTGVQVDRVVGGYKDSLDRLEKELAFWRSAAERKDAVIDRQAEQLHKLMSYAKTGTYALETVLAEAARRDVAP